MNIKHKYSKNPETLHELLELRGIESINNFIHPVEDMVLSPFRLDNIKAAVLAIPEFHHRKTLLVADSDCDGQCATAILYNYLRKVYPDWDIEIFIHERKQHGLEDVVEELELSEYDLVLLPDAGSNDDAYVSQYPGTLFIILDHHIRTVKTPNPINMIIVNNQESEHYSNKALSGAGVTWQFCRAFDEVFHFDYANDFIDLAAVAIIGDIMNIATEENRYITYQGLQSLHNTFLIELINKAAFQMGNKITPIGIAFYVVPMINSMCRVGTQDEKRRMIEAFTNPTKQVESHKRGANGTMIDVSTESVRECTNAKSRQKRIQEQMSEYCDQTIIEESLNDNKLLLIPCDEKFDDIPSEINGLAATKLAGQYNKPTLIGRITSDGYLRGSARGVSTIDMPPLKSLLASSSLFEYTEGHENAFGFSIKISRVPTFMNWINDALSDVEMSNNKYDVDYSFNGVTQELKDAVLKIDELSNSWGQGNPEPLFHIKNLNIKPENIKVCGSKNDTVQINTNGITLMLFKQTVEQIQELVSNPYFILEVVGTGNKNVWGGRVTPQIFIKDYELSRKLEF